MQSLCANNQLEWVPQEYLKGVHPKIFIMTRKQGCQEEFGGLGHRRFFVSQFYGAYYIGNHIKKNNNINTKHYENSFKF